jgi:hypothetical protein
MNLIFTRGAHHSPADCFPKTPTSENSNYVEKRPGSSYNPINAIILAISPIFGDKFGDRKNAT